MGTGRTDKNALSTHASPLINSLFARWKPHQTGLKFPSQDIM